MRRESSRSARDRANRKKRRSFRGDDAVKKWWKVSTSGEEVLCCSREASRSMADWSIMDFFENLDSRNSTVDSASVVLFSSLLC